MWTDSEQEFLDTQKIGRLATIGPSGPQVRPVGFVVNRELGTVDIGGVQLSGTQKWRNVRADGRVAFVVDDLGAGDEFAPRGLEVRGHAETVEDGTELIRIRPDKIVSWGLDSTPFAPTVRLATS